MNTIRYVFVLVVMTVVPGLIAPANAAVTNGFFAGAYLGSKQRAHVFVKSVKTRANGFVTTTNYGLIIRKGQTASFFRIEELEDGTQAWVELFQTADNLLASEPTQSATYEGRMVVRNSNQYLTLSPTPFGKTLGCNEIIEARPSDQLSWVSFPKTGDHYTSSHGKFDYTYGHINGRFDLDGSQYNGDFTLEPLTLGAALLRSRTLDSEAESGHSLQKEFTALVISIKHKDRELLVFNDDYVELRLIRLKPGIASCQMPSSKVDND